MTTQPGKKLIAIQILLNVSRSKGNQSDNEIWSVNRIWLLLKPGPGPWTRTQKNLDPEKPGPRKTWTLKNLDPEKRGKQLDASKR